MKSQSNHIFQRDEANNSRFRFYIVKMVKWLYILFKSKKNLKEVEFNYYKNWHFDNAYLIIKYEFLNAIWIDINGVKKIYSNIPIVLNLQNIDTHNLDVFVYGFFSRKKYTISLNKQERLNNQLFKTEVLQIGTISPKASVINSSIPLPILTRNNPKLTYKALKVFDKTIQINHNKFKLQDYL